jgi:hypothetical protein
VSFLSNHVEGHFSFFTLNTSQYDADSSQYDDDGSQYDDDGSQCDADSSQYDADTSQYDADTSQCDDDGSQYDDEVSQYADVTVPRVQVQFEIPHCIRNDGFPGDIKGKSAVAAKPPLHFFPSP